MGKVLFLNYESSLTGICEQNSSFDKGVLKIAYVGANRNRSFISKETFERCLKSMFNCPVVCNYSVSDDCIGGHDVDIVKTDSGLKMINMTAPVGVLPESANYWWETVEEDDGMEHEYLCAEILLWKRQPAYAKIKADGIESQSMEINVIKGKKKDGLYIIDEFEFTAFCLLGEGITPCFESASVEVFSKSEFKEEFGKMMEEFKLTTTQVASPTGVDDIDYKTYMEGGQKVLDEKLLLVEKYGLNVDDLDFALDDFSLEELTEKFEAMKGEGKKIEGAVSAEDKFALNSQIGQALYEALCSEKIKTEWGEECRYCMVDFDIEKSEVYCMDAMNGWNLYGFAYSMNGDIAVVDFGCCKRKKYAIVDFDEGEQIMPMGEIFERASEQFKALKTENEELSEKYQSASDTIESMNEELDTLRQFKTDKDAAEAQNKRDAIFAQFEDLAEVEAFKALKEHADEYDLEALEDKCYSLRGRQSSVAKFSMEQPVAPKQKVDKNASVKSEDKAPYGGIVEKYRNIQ